MPKQTKDIKACIRKDVNSIERKVQALYPDAKEVTVEDVFDRTEYEFTTRPKVRKTVVTVIIEVIEEI